MKRATFLTLLFLGASGLFSVAVFGQMRTDPITEKKIKTQRLLRIYSSLEQFEGVAIVMQGDEVWYKYTTGYANLDYRIPNSLTAKYNLTGITEAITATAVMQLVEAGKLGLDDKVGLYVPDAPSEIAKNVTINHLLTHTSGIYNYYESAHYIKEFYDIDKLADLLEIISRHPVHFAAGTEYRYSASDYVYLAAVIEAVSGQAYPDFVRERVVGPAGMVDSGLYTWSDTVFNRAIGYSYTSHGRPLSAPEYWGGHPFGADAVFGTVEDVVRFVKAFFVPRKLVSEQSRKDMLAVQVENIDGSKGAGYGMGWKVKDAYGAKCYFQGGNLSSLSTQVRYYPDDGYVFAIFANRNIDMAAEVADAMERALFDDRFVVPAEPLAYYFADAIEHEGIDYVARNFDDIMVQNRFKLERVWSLNALGRELMNSGKFAEALEVFKINQGRFPDENIVYDSLGDLYLEMGDYDKSIEQYNKRLAMLPGDSRSLAMIEKASRLKSLPVEERPLSPLAFSLSKPDSKSGGGTVVAESKPTVVANGTSVSPAQVAKPEVYAAPVPAPEAAKEAPKPDMVHSVADVMPSFPGGQAAMMAYIDDNLKYPAEARVNMVEGTVYVKFVVQPDGSLSNIALDKGMDEEGESCNEEALRLVRNMPRWTPGLNGKQPVKVAYTIPVRFER